MSKIDELWSSRPVVYARRALFWSGLAAVAYALCRLKAAVVGRPLAPVGWELVGGVWPWVAFGLVVGVGLVFAHSFRRIALEEGEAHARDAVGQIRDALGALHRDGGVSGGGGGGGGGLDSFRQTVKSRGAQAELVQRLEREADRLRRRMDQLVSEARASEAQHRKTVDALRAHLAHYRGEAEALGAKSSRLDDALRQAHIDLAYVKDRAARVISRRRPGIFNRARELLLGNTVSREILDLISDLEALGRPHSPVPTPVRPGRPWPC